MRRVVARPARTHPVRTADRRRGRPAACVRLRLAAGDGRRARPVRVARGAARRTRAGRDVRRRSVGLAGRDRGDRGRGAQPARARRVPAAAGPRTGAVPARARNTPLRSRKDIAAHYDLGNDLFALMLDETMMYSGAVFERRDMTLAEASRAKLERICDKLDLGPSDHVLEIGTGWGGFALHAAATRGCRVTTTTLSREQRELALERVRDAGLQDRVTILLDDYRELTGTYDKLVSIEMIEAVGWKDFGTFFERCASLLRPDGVMALQAITIDDRLYDVEKAQRSFMNSLIFPNGCLPSIEVIARTSPAVVTCEWSTSRTSPRTTPRRCGAGGRTSTPARSASLARLRRALPAPVAAVPLVLRGGIHRAPDRQRADRAGQAALARPPRHGRGARAAVRRRRGGRVKAAAIAVLGARVAYGAALLVVPDRSRSRWLGPRRRSGEGRAARPGGARDRAARLRDRRRADRRAAEAVAGGEHRRRHERHRRHVHRPCRLARRLGGEDRGRRGRLGGADRRGARRRVIAHTRRGSGPPLVLIHALGTDRHMWDPVLDRLAAERDVIAVDMPGFGDSPPLAAPRAAPRRAGLARRHARAGRASHAARARARRPRAPAGARLDRPHVAGNSLGGWVALELALAGHAQSVTAIAPAGLWAQPLMPKRSTARLIARALRPADARAAAQRARPARGAGRDDRASRAGPVRGRAAARARVRGRARLRGRQRRHARRPFHRPGRDPRPAHAGLARARPARRAARATCPRPRASTSCAAAATCRPGTTPSRSPQVLLAGSQSPAP